MFVKKIIAVSVRIFLGKSESIGFVFRTRTDKLFTPVACGSRVIRTLKNAKAFADNVNVADLFGIFNTYTAISCTEKVVSAFVRKLDFAVFQNDSCIFGNENSSVYKPVISFGLGFTSIFSISDFS